MKLVSIKIKGRELLGLNPTNLFLVKILLNFTDLMGVVKRHYCNQSLIALDTHANLEMIFINYANLPPLLLR
ncbi:Uncharacterised protein [Klebsiella pneumoniae]|uniref:Uncharacterized protein n=1 Tax=Klebsiella pneumoniae TaxID=573 RepID=A0A508ZMM3_KLEPN|nr:Uncharacterised protein [Klebsiella pneumoniae]